jgi:hypothetical protein
MNLTVEVTIFSLSMDYSISHAVFMLFKEKHPEAAMIISSFLGLTIRSPYGAVGHGGHYHSQ